MLPHSLVLTLPLLGEEECVLEFADARQKRGGGGGEVLLAAFLFGHECVYVCVYVYVRVVVYVCVRRK